MSLRLKLVIALVALSAFATFAIGAVSYRSTATQLRSEIDASLQESVRRFADRPGGRGQPGRRERADFRAAGDTLAQFVDPAGRVVSAQDQDLPVDAIDEEIAAGRLDGPRLRDVELDEEPFRLLTVGAVGPDRQRVGGAVQAARSLSEADAVLAQLRNRILVAALAVTAAAALVAWIIARQVTKPLVRLTGAAEHVASTGQLAVEVPVSGDDETGRLGTAFNAMLAALARSRDDQKRLVQDAGHELRTPLTSLRTNIYSLRRSDELDANERDRLVEDLESETAELSRLIDEVVELASDRRTAESMRELALGPLVQRVAHRAEQRSGRPVHVDADGTEVVGRVASLERAVSNLIENALKFDLSGGPIEVDCRDGSVRVKDRGPGFDPDDLGHVFERFYRSVEARSRPGSGLGLSIVADVVAEHGGTVDATNRDGGGAVVGFTIPVSGSLT